MEAKSVCRIIYIISTKIFTLGSVSKFSKAIDFTMKTFTFQVTVIDFRQTDRQTDSILGSQKLILHGYETESWGGAGPGYETAFTHVHL